MKLLKCIKNIALSYFDLRLIKIFNKKNINVNLFTLCKILLKIVLRYERTNF